jgi:hypothetical protein
MARIVAAREVGQSFYRIAAQFLRDRVKSRGRSGPSSGSGEPILQNSRFVPQSLSAHSDVAGAENSSP